MVIDGWFRCLLGSHGTETEHRPRTKPSLPDYEIASRVPPMSLDVYSRRSRRLRRRLWMP